MRHQAFRRRRSDGPLVGRVQPDRFRIGHLIAEPLTMGGKLPLSGWLNAKLRKLLDAEDTPLAAKHFNVGAAIIEELNFPSLARKCDNHHDSPLAD